MKSYMYGDEKWNLLSSSFTLSTTIQLVCSSDSESMDEILCLAWISDSIKYF